MKRLGWDQPLYVQLGSYLKGVFLRGDLGDSMLHQTPVRDELLEKFPATIELAFFSMIIAIPIGIFFGTAAAVWRNRLPDYLCMSGSLIGVSVPVFFLGICMIAISEDWLGGFFPVGRRLPVGMRFDSTTGFYILESLFRGRWDVFSAAIKHLFMPALALSTIPAAIIARITRSSMLEVLSADYVRTARAKGGSRFRVIMRHAFPNASIPIANIIGLQASVLLSGAVLTETVFSWPGIGRYLVEAVRSNDYTVVQGSMLLIATIFALSNFMLDLLYAWLDPRVGLKK